MPMYTLLQNWPHPPWRIGKKTPKCLKYQALILMFPRAMIMTMTKVDFYLIKENSLETGLNIVCRLLDKAYQQKHAVYIQVSSEETARILDDLLWTFREDSFIPHNLANQSEIIQSPVLIGFSQEP